MVALMRNATNNAPDSIALPLVVGSSGGTIIARVATQTGLRVTGNTTGWGIEGYGGNAGGGVYGEGSGAGTGVTGTGGLTGLGGDFTGTAGGVAGGGAGVSTGVLGYNSSLTMTPPNYTGVAGQGGDTDGSYGGYFGNAATNGHGAKGVGTGTGTGLTGIGITGDGVSGTSTSGAGTYGEGPTGVSGQGTGGNDTGVAGVGSGTGVGGYFIGGDDIAVDVNSQRIVNVKDPTAGQNAATKNYVDGAVQNYCINGGFHFWQRYPAATALSTSETGPGPATRTYHADRWYGMDAFGTLQSGFQTTRIALTGTGWPNAMKFQRMVGEVASPDLGIVQEIDRSMVLLMRDKKVTLSAWIKKGADFTGSFTMEVVYGTGALGETIFTGYTGSASAISAAQTLTTTLAQYTATSAAVVPVTATTMAIYFKHNGGVGAAGADDSFQVTGVQLNDGVGPPPPWRLAGGDIGGEFTLCERYFEKSWLQDKPVLDSVGAYLPSTDLVGTTMGGITELVYIPNVLFKTMKRDELGVIPAGAAVKVFKPGSTTADNVGIGAANAAAAIAYTYLSEGGFTVTFTGNHTTGDRVWFQWLANFEI
jgi:hypothetical protein